MHLLFTPNHIQLLKSCYPPGSALQTAGPDYSPNSHELSRLTYYASNHPGKLTKIASELERRLRSECRKAKAGNIRTRASLLISLLIFRALATECRRDIALLSPSLIAAVDVTLAAVPQDLEVVARAASVFTAWTTYTDGHLIGADSSMTKDYLSTLRRFSSLSCNEIADPESRNRGRLIGFAALSGALNSEALYNDSTQFRTQVSVMLQPIMMVLFQTPLSTLDDQASVVKDTPASPYLAEFRTRPAMERRAASIHIHIDGDKGPSESDVSDAAVRALFCLLNHAGGSQLGCIMASSFDSLDSFLGWTSLSHCCWFAKKTADWAQYQYRYVVPTWLVERLLENQNAATSTPVHVALTAMVTAVFSSSTPLINLSSSDIMSNLLTLLLRRTAISAEDALLPSLVDCVASLGCHVYYADQIQDLAGELINRLVIVEVQGVSARDKPTFVQSRSSAIRRILAGLLGLIRSANKTEIIKGADAQNSPTSDTDTPLQPYSSSANVPRRDRGADERLPRRTRIAPDVWQDTLSLVCDSDDAVRMDYADALTYYLAQEMPKIYENVNASRMKHGEGAHLNHFALGGDSGSKFLNAIHAYIYLLTITPASTSTNLPPPNSSSPSDPIISLDTSHVNLPDSPRSPASERRLSVPHGPRMQKVSLVRRLLEGAPSRVISIPMASPTDYANILKILTAVQEHLPVRGLLTGVPMLLALNAATEGHEGAPSQNIIFMKGVIARVLLVIGKVWNSDDLQKLVEEALSSAPLFPVGSRTDEGGHPPFPCVSWPGVDLDAALMAIASCEAIQEATGMDKDGLHRQISSKWTAEAALRNSNDVTLTNYDSTIRGDGISPLLKISPALMHIENVSLQSLARSTRGLGVTDLREALEGRSSMSNPALTGPPSISTLDHASSMTGGDAFLRLTQTRSRTRSKKRGPPSGSSEVRDVLTRLGIGKQNGNLLKASLLQKND